ncbi:type II toxin-antitoxin system VapC family toxin [Acidithiobacillus montserratensis]|uniref:Type II toxin-antitoxin system VapC family toxin n=1 Tax=Acidithiobacillus montserratensis TaxID=2729135 RepID=A0ACD5HID0_9PROT|nr:type II toxin-antitoxin system VapC family toxin [Acidithiobacillus montserratensis]MBN2679337.1 type II toxin-antitoxin system VapC family toxin [Acidithiobacillaceae bacterium]MBU2749241.1 type II toxin-antitoxin system VapC family toxin [Acidithiobacillus montserratensis]
MQRLLLDTNILLALLIAPERLPEELCNLVADPHNQVWFSAASLWEIAIKSSLRREDFDFCPEDVHALALQSALTELPVLAAHTYAVAQLPWVHKDPFDRLLLAQAMTLDARLLTTDHQLTQYAAKVELVPWKG